jgi:AbrB family looped-hinge helix DNA binding protein
VFSELIIDDAGRVTLPANLREELQLEPGDVLLIEASKDRIVLQPVRSSGPLVQEDGIWVYRSGHPCSQSIPDLIDAIRSERDVKNLGIE